MGKFKNIAMIGLGALVLSGCANPFVKTADEACGPRVNPGTLTKEGSDKLGEEDQYYLFLVTQTTDYLECRTDYDDIRATYVLGLLYLEGFKVEKDVQKAIALFSKTGPQPRQVGHYDSAPAGNMGGSMETFEISSGREGLPAGRYQLGKIFVYGLNGEVNMELGLWHLEIASLQGDQRATDLLATLPWDGVLDGKIDGELPQG